MDNEVLQRARATFETLCRAMEAEDMPIDRDDEELTVLFGVIGDYFPIIVQFRVDPEAQVVSLFSPHRFAVEVGKYIEVVLAAAYANYGMINGNFDCNLANNEISFRIASSFRDSILGEELFSYMLNETISVWNRYGNSFRLLCDGTFELQQFIERDQQHRNN